MSKAPLLASLAAVVLLVGPAAAQQGDAAAPTIRARIDALRLQGSVIVLGEVLVAEDALAAFYERRGYQPAWTRPGQVAALLEAIEAVKADGLDPRDYLFEPLTRHARYTMLPGASAVLRADVDLLATAALIRLAGSLTTGKVDPATLDTTWHHPPAAVPVTTDSLLDALVTSDSLVQRIAALGPRHPMYLRLRSELARYREVEAAGGWGSIAPGPQLEAGMADPRIPSLRQRLAVTGDLPPLVEPDTGTMFSPALAEALGRFQQRTGLAADGVLGPRSLAELNQPVADRINTIRINLERGRWVLPGLGGTYVVVNIAGFESYFVRNDTLAWEAPSIVGQPFRQTPEFRATMTYLVLNPRWTVPTLLLDEDVLPAVRGDTAYLREHAMQVIDRQGEPVDPSTIDWEWYRGRSFPYRIVQAPGGSNPLGRIKFMFPNPYAVYLHDTPARTLFRKPQRAFSSGCIRVEHPMGLAELLLEGSPWTAAQLDTALAFGTERTIPLPRAVPVLVLYWTAWADGDGIMQFRPDVYQRDAAVLRALDAPYTVPPRNP